MNIRFFTKTCQKWMSVAFASVLILSSHIAHAEQKVTVENGYIRATIPGTDVSSAYMVISNHSMKNKKLIGASSDISSRIEIHEHQMSDGMMKMRQLDAIEINMHDTVTLQPSGLHLMIFELTEPLNAGDNVALNLHFEDGERLAITLPVESIKRKSEKAHQHNHH
ncbi:copper chaperone PCu(A)C [Thalassotalea sp. 1_MG-2023]|uniref:copper chaperone PCu(A)C n=1 Tax=Thalassotalea sp. 1_MG-2023 TaxID=3062680 RepID=UPI0026E276F3|nr:copper chaperone PCu(A)C [Thalassotalea sp. 1_MG-2023]MDO6426259.1 copper chaperone PCu(A)C [Thalassotalea sp. 1_MG-2023]